MKAQEYFDIYKYEMWAAKTDEEYEKVVLAICQAMRDEMHDMIKKRNIRYCSSVTGTVKEFNQKWNKIIRLFKEAEINCPMKVDGFYENEKAIYAEMGIKL